MTKIISVYYSAGTLDLRISKHISLIDRVIKKFKTCLMKYDELKSNSEMLSDYKLMVDIRNKTDLGNACDKLSPYQVKVYEEDFQFFTNGNLRNFDEMRISWERMIKHLQKSIEKIETQMPIIKERYLTICKNLLDLIEPTTNDNLTFIAELQRCVGLFEKCLETINLIDFENPNNSISHKRVLFLATIIKRECEKSDTTPLRSMHMKNNRVVGVRYD